MALILWIAAAWSQESAPEPNADEEIVVVAELGPAESSASMTRIDVDALPASADLASAIGASPGTAVRRLGGLGDFASVSIRGSSARQVEVYLDGVPLNPEGADTVNLAELPLRAFERVEVYRGNAPPELGSSAIGGVVHLLTGEPRGGELAVGAGSWGTLVGHGSAAGGMRDGDALLVVDGMRTDGRFSYLDDRGTASVPSDDRIRERANNDRQQAALHARLRRGPWTVFSSGLLRETGVPGFTWLPSRQARFWTARELLVLGWEGRSDAASGAVQSWGRIAEERLDDPAGELGLLPGATRVVSRSGGVRGHARWSPGPLSSWVGALELRSSGARTGGVAAGGREAAEGSAAVTLRDEAERVAITPVLQGTLLLDRSASARITTAAATPRLGALLALGDGVALALNGGAYLRPPDLTERFGNQGVMVGNPDLAPERGLSGDAGLRVERGGVRGELVFFGGRAVDRIGWQQNSQGLARPENLDRVDTLGAEAASTGAAGWVRWTASYTWTAAVQRSDSAFDGQQVPGVPLMEWHHRVGFGSERVGVDHLLDASSGTPLDPSGLVVTAPRWIHGAAASIRDRALTVELDVMNLLDRTVETGPRDPLVDDGTTAERPVTDFFGYPLPGRTFLLTLRIDV